MNGRLNRALRVSSILDQEETMLRECVVEQLDKTSPEGLVLILEVLRTLRKKTFEKADIPSLTMLLGLSSFDRIISEWSIEQIRKITTEDEDDGN